MKLITLLALASASVVTAHASNSERTYYRVKINAEATLQTDFDETTSAKVTTSDVLAALIDEYDRDNLVNLPSTKTSDYDLIACYAGDDDQIMEAATYYLVRTRGSGNHFKIQIPTGIFDTESGDSVFKRVFTANNSSVKVNVTDSFAILELDTSSLYIYAEGLAKAQVTVKNVDDEVLGDEYLSLVKNNFNGYHSIETDEDNGVGTINAKIEGKLKTETFDELLTLSWLQI